MESGSAAKRHALIFVTVTILIDVIGFGIIMPVLPALLMELSGSGLSEASRWAGLLIFSYAALQFLCAPLLGNLSDRFGRRPLLLVSLAIYGVNYLLMGFAGALWMLFLGRVLTGIAGSTYAVANALIADVSPPEERAQNFGLLGMAFGLGYIVGPMLGGLLGEWHTRAPFFAAAGLAACNMTYGFFVLKETLPRTLRRKFELKRANPLGALLKIRRYPMLVGLLVALFFYNVGHHVYPANWSFYVMEKFRWTAFDIGVSLGFVGVLLALVQGGLIRVAIPRLGAPRTALIGLFAATAAYIGFAFAPNGLALYLWCFVAAVSGLIMPALQGMMSAEVPQNEQGELQGMIASVGSVGAIVGPLLLTQLFGYFTSSAAPVYFPGAAFLAAGVLSLLALMLFVKSARIDRELPELVR